MGIEIKEINELPQATALTGAELFELEQASLSVKDSLANITEFISAYTIDYLEGYFDFGSDELTILTDLVVNGTINLVTLTLSAVGSLFYSPVAGEESGGTWHKVKDPPQGWLATKIAGWTADQFTPGGMEVDFSALVPAGTKAVRVMVYKSANIGVVYYRKSGDTNISNTPHASLEYSHRILVTVDYANLVELWLSSDYKVQFAVTNINVDLYIPYPTGYMV